MNINKNTFKIFIERKFGLIKMTNDEQVYDMPNHNNFLFFYPNRNKIQIRAISGRDEELSMLTISNGIDKEFFVKNNTQITKILDEI